jgi:16S rRNA (cytosine967-C5)-methyltransferase
MRGLPQFWGTRHTARSLALQVLLDCRRHEGFVGEVLDRHLAGSPLSAADRRLATQLCYGVLRRRGTLQALVEPFVRRPPQRVEVWLWDALHLGAYQLALLESIPVHAAVHETVELAGAYNRPGARGFLNAVLRKLVSLLTAEAAVGPAADALPLERGAYRRLAQPLLPDPQDHPVEYLAAGFGLPAWLVQRWLPRYGVEECLRLGFWFASPAPLTLRVNPLRIDREALLAALASAGVRAEPGSHPQAIRLGDFAVVRELPGFAEGWFCVQDESTMRVASALAPPVAGRVLDLCAAPGGKTTHLAELMGGRGTILACDVDEQRLQTVQALAARLGHTCIQTLLIHREGESGLPSGLFDAALVDVPCSNTGVLGRRPEARWRLGPEDIAQLVSVQTHLLTLAAERVRPGGVIVYSTCSIEPEENQHVVQAVLAARPDLLLQAEEEARPGCPADGGYWVRLLRTGPQ